MTQTATTTPPLTAPPGPAVRLRGVCKTYDRHPVLEGIDIAVPAGQLTAILGTISMDLTTIDLSHTTALAPGDEVTLLGREGEVCLDAQQIARAAGTISYNILCSISARVRRVYV